MRTFISILFVFIAIIQCSKMKDAISPYNGTGIAFYILENRNLLIQEALQKDLNSLKTQSNPWLTSDNISIYDYSTHLIYLKGDKKFISLI
jgi:hypothetical protein